MIELQKITVRFGEKTVLDQFSATIPDQGVTAVFGDSGKGKTTLLRVLMGLIKPLSGNVVGMEGRRPAVVFQEDRLLPWMTALENASIAGEQEIAREYLVRLGLEDALKQRPAALSGGMKRRVALARALAYQGDLLLLDEPFNGLDDGARRTAAGILLAENIPALVITHDLEEAELLHAVHRIQL